MIDTKQMSLDEMVKLALKSKDATVLNELAESDCLNAQIFVASNKHTSRRTLKALAQKCKSPRLCEALMNCPKLDKATKQMLATVS